MFPHNDTHERRVNMEQLPNMLKEQTWETPGVNDTLAKRTQSKLDSNGTYCFKAIQGLWRIWPEPGPGEEHFVWTQNDIRAYVTNIGMHNLNHV